MIFYDLVFWDFKEAVLNWSIFAIITARWQSKENLKNWIKLIIQNMFSNDEKRTCFEIFKRYFVEKYEFNESNFEVVLDKYLKYCKFYWVNHPKYLKKYGLLNNNQHISKPKVFEEFLIYILKLKNIVYKDKDVNISVWFSDDEIKEFK